MLHENRTLTVIVDVQEKLFDAMAGRDELLRGLRILAQGSRALRVPLLYTEQLPDKLGPTVEPLRELLPEPATASKSAFSCWREPAFARAVRAADRPEILLAGIETHVCILQTARDLLDRGFAVHVVADAVSSRRTRDRDLALQAMRDEGARITCTEAALLEMLGDAQRPEFKEILALIR
ncbi:hydrolase [Kiritimatiella glycovorans]|uniref:Isochorismatase family protein n=1 Tax=Kiritimatiella glycovorans TaxID=1307763 RepID=A0A0G3ELH2_9BACT|nr:hydrolase [Kiritimatiella glycovorans]AKJ64984.1 Isochorismatase family protein [Kiritimatiella glycovorans]